MIRPWAAGFVDGVSNRPVVTPILVNGEDVMGFPVPVTCEECKVQLCRMAITIGLESDGPVVLPFVESVSSSALQLGESLDQLVLPS